MGPSPTQDDPGPAPHPAPQDVTPHAGLGPSQPGVNFVGRILIGPWVRPWAPPPAVLVALLPVLVL